MDEPARKHFQNLHLTGDADARYNSYKNVLKQTQEPVAWSYEILDDLLAMMRNGDNLSLNYLKKVNDRH